MSSSSLTTNPQYLLVVETVEELRQHGLRRNARTETKASANHSCFKGQRRGLILRENGSKIVLQQPRLDRDIPAMPPARPVYPRKRTLSACRRTRRKLCFKIGRNYVGQGARARARAWRWAVPLAPILALSTPGRTQA